MLKKLGFLLLCFVLAGCKVNRTYRGYKIIDAGREEYLLSNEGGSVLGPKIKQWNVWKEYLFLYKTAQPGDFSQWPYTDQAGYAIVDTTNAGVQFFVSIDQFEAAMKKLGAPEELLILHKIPGPWRPSKEDAESTDTAKSSKSAPVFFPSENPAAANP